MAVVRVSDEARDQWTDFARSCGVSVSALLEAAAALLPHPDDPGLEDPRIVAIIEAARDIDVERRRRG